MQFTRIMNLILEQCKGVLSVDLGECFQSSNVDLLAEFGFDRAENEPCKDRPPSRHRSRRRRRRTRRPQYVCVAVPLKVLLRIRRKSDKNSKPPDDSGAVLENHHKISFFEFVFNVCRRREAPDNGGAVVGNNQKS